MAAIFLLGHGTARAETVPFHGQLALGESGTRTEIRVETEFGRTNIVVGAPRHRATASISGAWREVEIERVTLATGAIVGILRGVGPQGRAAALVTSFHGRPAIPWVGRLEMHGDPGERTADLLDLGDRTGDGQADIVVAQVREGVTLCDGSPALLYPRALDPATHELRPVVLRRFASDGEELAIVASPTSPGPQIPPIVRSLIAVGATSQAGVTEAAEHLAPPWALVDGNPETYWAEGRGGPGEGEFVQLRFGAQMPIRAIAITRSEASATSMPQNVVLVGDRGPRLRVAIPPTTGRAWIVPPAPLEWSCFAVVLADAQGAPATRT